MANVFAILSAIALAASAFIASKNQTKYKEEISARQQQETELARNKRELASLTEQYNTTAAEHKATKEETVVLREEEAGQQTKNKALDDEIAGKTTQSEQNAAKIEEIEKGIGEISEIETLADQLNQLKEELATLNDTISLNEARIVDLTSEKRRTDGIIGDFRTKDGYFNDKRSFFTSTRIGSIFPTYGFVTLPIGNVAGVVAGSNLNVTRGGEVIAKLRVRSVEGGRASADIIPDSIGEDVVLMVGDRVVPSGEAGK